MVGIGIMVINRKEIQTREMRALTIVGQSDQIKRINAVTYKVKSQNSDCWYDVIHVYKHGWTCTCNDFLFRHERVGDCKHIQAVYISKELRHKVLANNDVKEIESDNKLVCNCGSLNIIKIGIRHNKSGDMQVFKCKECSKKWSDNLGFAKNRIDSKIITVALDLYFKGISLRKVKEHVKLFYGISVSHVAILKWIHKFGEVVAPFVDSLVPKDVSGVYHVDEMMVHVRKEQHEKGHYQWLWNMMDNTTRFWISSKVSQRREVSDARAVFQDAKRKTPTPIAIVHDGLPTYNEAYWKEYYTMEGKRVKNIRSVSVRHDGLNQKIERLNGVFRDREKVMRGMDHKESAQKLIDATRIHYNFIREHGSIKKTPAEQAGINLDLGQNKIEGLIKLASKPRKLTQTTL
ncbi:MAG: IS1/IS6 family transposase [Thaumarchaeota archaeon]|nr:IS1/IS6 family transposase [Nitrososphaerota archaeon]